LIAERCEAFGNWLARDFESLADKLRQFVWTEVLGFILPLLVLLWLGRRRGGVGPILDGLGFGYVLRRPAPLSVVRLEMAYPAGQDP